MYAKSIFEKRGDVYGPTRRERFERSTGTSVAMAALRRRVRQI